VVDFYYYLFLYTCVYFSAMFSCLLCFIVPLCYLANLATVKYAYIHTTLRITLCTCAYCLLTDLIISLLARVWSIAMGVSSVCLSVVWLSVHRGP